MSKQTDDEGKTRILVKERSAQSKQGSSGNRIMRRQEALYCECREHLRPRGDVHFQDPGLEVLVQHDVETEELMAAVGSPHIHLQQAGHIWF